MRWCVMSLDRDAAGAVVGERWCVLKRRIRGDRPEYRDHEETACCGQVITLPCGYLRREPTCGGVKMPTEESGTEMKES